jgi:hypothetical protein
MSLHLSRRHFLRGLGATIALPMLDVMAPARAIAGAASGSGAAPLRMAFMFVPNGVHMPDWTPSATGSAFDLPYILEPLAPVKRDLMVLSGLTHDKGRNNDDGAGDHARSAGVFLTGSQPLKTEGKIRAGGSVDQFAASQLGGDTRFPSLELGTEGGRPYGKCDSGYSCAYSNSISWRDPSTPMMKMTEPREVFERLFGDIVGKDAKRATNERSAYRKSVLDYVLDDAKRLESKVGSSDRQKLDEYLTSVREIEKRIESSENSEGDVQKAISYFGRPEGTPDTAEEHLRLLGDMMVLAFQTDTTRVSSFMFANAGSNRAYREIGINDGHHSLSHHQNDKRKLDKIRDINRHHVQQLSYILQRLKSIPEGDGSLLDNCMIVYGSGICDGNRHNNENLPILFAGGGGGRIKTGLHLEFRDETPVCNLFNSMLDTAGAKVDLFGDSTGRLSQLTS